MTQVRHVCFTVNNWTEEQMQQIWDYDGWEYLVVGKEVGEQGTPHLQCYGCFKTKRKYAKLAKQWKAAFFPTKGTPQQAADYCKKDGDYLERGVVPLAKNEAGGQAMRDKWIAARQDPLAAFNRGDLAPGQLAKLLIDIDIAQSMEERKDKADLSAFIPNTWGVLMPVRSDKKKHYWVWSEEPNRGKTTWLKSLQQHYKADFYEYAENFQQLHGDTQVLMFDEYSVPHLKVTVLNRMCDGTYKFPRKGTTPLSLTCTLVVCGNKNPREIYPHAYKYIEARFNVIELK